MIVLDASVPVAFLDLDDSHQAVAETLLAAEAIGDDLGANPLKLAEVLAVPARERSPRADPGGTSRTCARVPGWGCRTVVSCSRAEAGATVASFDDRLAQTAADRNLAVLGR